MSENVAIALVSFAGTFLATLGGYRLSVYRIGQLEKKVDMHNGVVERVFKLEGRSTEMEHFATEIKSDISDIRADISEIIKTMPKE